jgi:hypothetical protein
LRDGDGWSVAADVSVRIMKAPAQTRRRPEAAIQHKETPQAMRVKTRDAKLELKADRTLIKAS